MHRQVLYSCTLEALHKIDCRIAVQHHCVTRQMIQHFSKCIIPSQFVHAICNLKLTAIFQSVKMHHAMC